MVNYIKHIGLYMVATYYIGTIDSICPLYCKVGVPGYRVPGYTQGDHVTILGNEISRYSCTWFSSQQVSERVSER